MTDQVLFEYGDDPRYSGISMVERAVRNAKPYRTNSSPRWVAVRDVFGFGSQTSIALCRRFGLDPHEVIKGLECEETP